MESSWVNCALYNMAVQDAAQTVLGHGAPFSLDAEVCRHAAGAGLQPFDLLRRLRAGWFRSLWDPCTTNPSAWMLTTLKGCKVRGRARVKRGQGGQGVCK